MRTTVDIPDAIYLKAKTKAALSGGTFKRYLTRTLQKDLENSPSPSSKKLRGPLVKKGKLIVADGEALEKILESEDRTSLG